MVWPYNVTTWRCIERFVIKAMAFGHEARTSFISPTRLLVLRLMLALVVSPSVALPARSWRLPSRAALPGFDATTRPLLESEFQHLWVADGVLQTTTAVRKVFDDRFANPREASRGRFAWDWWHVTHRDEDKPRPRVVSGGKAAAAHDDASEEFASLGDATVAAAAAEEAQRSGSSGGGGGGGHDSSSGSSSGGYGAASAAVGPGHGQQYTMLRTPAADYLDEETFETLCAELTEYGRQQLGCDAITPPWLALYTDGCSQNFHTDAPHGPFAFVLSLTPEGAHQPEDGASPGWFEGGETLLLRPWVCDYWRGYDPSRGLEYHSLFETVAPRWNRLTVFDARLPHGVSPVRGTRDPRRARLVLTGWFSEPQISVSGLLADGGDAEAAALAVVEANVGEFTSYVAEAVSRVTGFLAARIEVNADGTVARVDALCDTLVADPAEYQGAIAEDDEGRDILEDACADVRFALNAALAEPSYPEASGPSTIIVPLSFS